MNENESDREETRWHGFPWHSPGLCSSAIILAPYMQNCLPCLLSQGQYPRSSLAGGPWAPAGMTRVKRACDFHGLFLLKLQASSMQTKPCRLRAASPDWTMPLRSLSGQHWPNHLGWLAHCWWLCPEVGSQNVTAQMQFASQLWVHVSGGLLPEAASADQLYLWISNPSFLEMTTKGHPTHSHRALSQGMEQVCNILLHFSSWLDFPFKIHMWTPERKGTIPWKKSRPTSVHSLLFDQWFSSSLCWTRRRN